MINDTIYHYLSFILYKLIIIVSSLDYNSYQHAYIDY